MSTDNATDTIQVDTDARGVARVTLNRPDKHNAFDDQMIADLQRAFDHLGKNPEVRVVILQSVGRSFSAGADLAWMQRMADYDYGHNLDDARALAQMLQTLKTLPQPTIARVQGHAFGGAVGLVSCCDVAIGSDQARFGLTEVRIGLIPATIGPHVIETIGARWARRLFLTGERFDASLATQLGLLHELCAADELDTRVDALIDELLKNSPAAMAAAKVLVRDLSPREVDQQMMDDTSARIAQLRVSDEGQEGLRAFLDKRAPAWLEQVNN